MYGQLEKINSDLTSYREAFDQLVSVATTTPADWRQRLFAILICASQLYLDYLLAMRDLPALEAVSSEVRSVPVRANTLRERELREQLQQKLRSSSSWNHSFQPKNPFSELTGLRGLQDYTERFTLHLPEIYEETLRVETCIKDFTASHDDSALAQIIVGLQHLGRNHISFVLQALEWAGDEDGWE